jgi:hypothetical protein
MKMVTYLFGAGASAKALPVAQGIADSLDELTKPGGDLSERIWKTHGATSFNPGFTPPWYPSTTGPGDYGTPFTSRLLDLREIAILHPSLDTYAKMLFFRNGQISNSPDQIEFKALIACYFLLLQAKDAVDPRYELFLASILGPYGNERSLPTLHPAVRILTWNYDSQLEKAYRGFVKDTQFVYETIDNDLEIIWRLNGTCASLFNPGLASKQLDLVFGGFNKTTIDDLNGIYKDMIKNPQPGIHPGVQFAWETEILDDNANRIANNTQVLIVCGYSFPYFNKDVDHLLLDAMTKLEKIYVQVRPDDFEQVKERIIRAFWVQKEIPIQQVKGTDEFYIPAELE